MLPGSMNVSPGNQTHYEISSPLQRGLLATWCFGTGTFAVIGNAVVLLASIRYKALKLDLVTGTLVEGIATADILYAISVIFPAGIFLCTNGWDYTGSEWSCILSTYLQHSLCMTDILLVCAMNIAKLAVILSPFAARCWTRRHGFLFIGIAVFLAHIYPSIGIGRANHFDWRSYRCFYRTVEGLWKWLGPLCIGLFILLPTVIVIVTTAALIYLVKRLRGANRRAVITLIPVSLLYIGSYTPVGIYVVAENWFETAGEGVYMMMNRYGMFIKFLNNSLNPLVYFITLASFRQFVLRTGGEFNKTIRNATMRSTTSSRGRCGSSKSVQNATGYAPGSDGCGKRASYNPGNDGSEKRASYNPGNGGSEKKTSNAHGTNC